MRFIILIISLMMISCQNENKAKFEITNNSGNTIDSICIKSFSHNLNTHYLKLEHSESQTYFLDMTDIPQVDGDYLLSFRINNNLEKRRFGYFTNGSPLEQRTKIEIRKDTVIIKPIFDKY
ncbi:MAG: hypothetical protein PHI36_06510 [Bacteroidales bacterium]|nr:hypothetical protein [Bacteroidales bacterium]MDD4576063.1 hypothetical protein [Bacteroidales bacterium]